MTQNHLKFKTVCMAMTCMFASSVWTPPPVSAQKWREALSLAGRCRFEIGDNMAYADPKFDDSKWEPIIVPGAWERQGFPGYDGHAWYRIHFQTPERASDSQLYVQLGSIDDVEETYLNGRLIGYQGGFPPEYFTAYNVHRRYLMPKEFLNPAGDNVLAVRVYDDELAGGIVEGDVGIFYDMDELQVAQPMQDPWLLHLGDDRKYAEPDYDDSDWQRVYVPGLWDSFGHQDYDGIGWYRTRFRVDDEISDERIILLVGRIDDVDQVFLNGEKLGETGPWPDDSKYVGYYGEHYLEYRAYYLPSKMLRKSGENVLAVRVFDALFHGGIWDGPIGLVTREQYMKWQHRRSLFEEIFLQLFGK